MKCKIYLHFEVNRTAQSLQKVFNIGIAQQELLNVLKMLGLVENLIDKFHINTQLCRYLLVKSKINPPKYGPNLRFFVIFHRPQSLLKRWIHLALMQILST